MDNHNKGTVIFKNNPQDFIVEEIWEDYICEVSQNIDSIKNKKAELSKLDLNSVRPFLTCDLEKINIDHFTVMSVLSNQLKNFPNELGYAGIKDKFAWTCQRISIFNPKIENIISFYYPGVLLKNFKWDKHKIKEGDIKGNKFNIVLRDADKDAIKILSQLRKAGEIPNYFGMQRFGSLRGDNFQIGKLILKQKFKEAVFTFLTNFGDDETQEVKIAKNKFKINKDISFALDYFPEHLIIECKILRHLLTSPDDYLGALNIIGEKTLTIMCQSVQSKLFNDILQKVYAENLALNNPSLNLIGFDSSFSSGRIGKIEKDVLDLNNLRFSDFNTPFFPFLRLKSSRRKSFFKVRDINVQTMEDEVFPLAKKIALTFTLDSGTYATTFLEQFFNLKVKLQKI